MKTGFDGSVPARKPKTQIGRVLTELTAESAATLTEAFEDDARQAPGRDASNGFGAIAVNEAHTSPAQRHDTQPPAGITRAAPAPVVQQKESRIAGERERLAALRERLALAAEPRSVGSEPQHTATAVRKLIDELRARLEAAVQERSDIALTLDATRTTLARTEAALEQERTARADLEAQADEREQVAVQAVAEAEALAAERDLVLSELAERRRLEDEQAALLADAEAALTRHREDHETIVRELTETLELRVAEVVNLETRLQTEIAGRARAEQRCRELEAQVARLTQSADALESIKSMIRPQR